METEEKKRLTPDEEAQFTSLNAAAFDLARKRALGKARIPAWLCMSEEAREEARKQLLKHMSDTTGIDLKTERDFNIVFRHAADDIAILVQRWKAMELELKEQREAGNPQAFFV